MPQMNNCEKCGKPKGWSHVCMIVDIAQFGFQTASERGKRQVIISGAVPSIKRMEFFLETASKIGEDYGYILKQETHSGGLIIHLSMVFEKIVTTADQTNFVNCMYCTTRYDANQFFKCPHCGSPTK